MGPPKAPRTLKVKGTTRLRGSKAGRSQMSLLKTLESKIEGLVEGTFGRVFRSEVRPIELARKLVREMDENRTSSVMRVYAPHEYEIWLSPQDRAQYEGVESEVIDELCAYLLEHARREQLTLAGRPSIRFHTDEDLQLGEFGIETHPVRLDEEEPPRGRSGAGEDSRPQERRERPPRGGGGAGWLGEAGAPPPGGDIGNTMLQSGAQRLREPLQSSPVRRDAGALLLVEGRQVVLPSGGGVIGRSRDCDIVLADTGVSRRHAEVRPGPDGWTVEDLGSTNGVRLAGRTIRGPAPLQSGDRIVLGSTEIVFELR